MTQLIVLRRVSTLDLEKIHTDAYVEQNGTSDGYDVTAIDDAESGTYANDQVSTDNSSRLSRVLANLLSQHPPIPFPKATPSSILSPPNQKMSSPHTQSTN